MSLHGFQIYLSEILQLLARFVDKHGHNFLVNNFSCIWNSLYVGFIRPRVVLLSLLHWKRLFSCKFSHKFLQRIGDPNVEKGGKRHDCEPKGSIVDWPRSIVTMHGKKTTYSHAPLDCFVSGRISKYIFKLECIIFATLFVRVIVKEVLVWRVVVANILPSKFVDWSNLLSVGLCPLTKVFFREILRGLCFPLRSKMGHFTLACFRGLRA